MIITDGGLKSISTEQPPTKQLFIQFARHALRRGQRTDNGLNLVSREVEEDLKEIEIEHRYNYKALLWPRANGDMKGQNRSLTRKERIGRTSSTGSFWHTVPRHIRLQEGVL